jgi:hypothetical protein
MTAGMAAADSKRAPVVVPEQDTVFRLAQLILLMTVAAKSHPEGTHLERLAAYDFIAANPLLMASADDDPDRLALLIAGFDDRALSYASPAQRFATRRERLQHDLALLVAYGLATTSVHGQVRYRLTETGHDLASRFTAMYARSYTAAARIVISRLRRVSDARLRDNMTEWTSVTTDAHGRVDLAVLFADPDEDDFREDPFDEDAGAGGEPR